MTKAEVRKQIKVMLQENLALLPELSAKICKKIIESPEYKAADVVLAYMALPDEVDLSLMIGDGIAKSKRIFIPRIIPDTNLMDFYEVPDSTLKTGIKTGSFGILEPDENWKKFDVASEEIQSAHILVLTPGRAFTLAGQRLGRGKGFYDTFFDKVQKLNVIRAGVCFSCQLVNELPVEEHDVDMQVMFTI